jgi:hypothetical protein
MRAMIFSRMGRTASMPCPAGSSSTQSWAETIWPVLATTASHRGVARPPTPAPYRRRC